MRNFRCICFATVLSAIGACCVAAHAQSDSAEISGRVTDPTGALVRGAEVELRDIARGTLEKTQTNRDGIYIFPFVLPGRYGISVGATGFKNLDLVNLTANAQDHIQQNFRLPVGARSESVTVTSDAKVDTDTSVSTIVDQNFVENMPLNGQSIQQLIAITPGVQRTSGAGQFSFNGVRDNQNYITVDGVSANTGTTAVVGGLGQQGAGQVGGYSALLTSSSLASLEDVQEIKIQSSSYTAEFGRGAGGQISITTQSGSNTLHGGLFEYLRNTAFDAFNSYTKFQYAQLLASNPSQAPLKKPVEHQNDFGGTLGGPIVVPHLYDGHNRSFFFFSTEALILKQPVSLATNVPGPCARTNSCTKTGIPSTPSNPQPLSPPIAPALLPYFQLAPPPNYIPATITFSNIPQFLSTYSNPSSAYATSLRLTHQLTSRISAFARASYSPSFLEARQANNITDTKFNQKSYTLGVNTLLSSNLSDELRLNYTRNTGANVYSLDNYGGGTAPSAALLAQMFPAQYGSSPLSDSFNFGETLGTQWGDYSFQDGTNVQNTQRQVNFADNLSWSQNKHSFKFGVDWRRLTPIAAPYHYAQSVSYSTLIGYSIPGSSSLSGANSGIPDSGFATSQDKVIVLINNVSLFAQDSWKATRHLTLNYGVRWDINPAPRGDGSQQLFGVVDVSSPANAILAPAGTQLFPTDYKTFQPRAGLAYELRGKLNWETQLRTGFGLYYDTNANTATNATSYYPHQRVASLYGVPWPTTSLPPPPAVNDQPPYTNQNILGFQPNFTEPRTWEWSLALQQGLGRNQSVQVSYVGSAGRNLARFSAYSGGAYSNRFLNLAVYSSLDYSNYDSLQVAYKRNLYKGLQVLANYTWAKSLDTTTNETSSAPNPAELDINKDYGLSVFDVRNNFNASIAYDFPTIQRAWKPVRYALKGWSVDAIFLVHSGNPLTATFSEAVGNYTTTTYRPNIVKGQPLWVSTPNANLTFPSCVYQGNVINTSAGQPVFPQSTFGHKALNPLAFDTCFAAGATTPVQGNEPRGYITGLAVRDLDTTIRREFIVHGAFHLQCRVDAFNVLNQTLYQNPSTVLGFYTTPTFYQDESGSAQYGTIVNTLNGSNTAGSNSIGGGYYGIGRSRSLQLAMKLKF